MAFRYRDTETGRFTKKSTWKRGKRVGSKRYKREKVKKPKRIIELPPPEMYVEWIVAIEYSKRRKFNADLVIVARRDATPTELADQAREQLPEGKSFLANWIEGAYADIAMGEATKKEPSTKIRSFVRHK